MDKRILVVEDESIVLLDITIMLKDAGFDVVGHARNGEKAIELAHALQPDLVLMDIKMPKMNGLKASDVISNTFQIPVLLLTAFSQREYIDEAKRANIVGYLVKPITEANLIPAVEIALLQAANTKKYQERNAQLDETLTNRKVIEKAKGIIMKRKNVTEEIAYNKLRRLSMDKQLSMETVARRIIANDQKQVNR
ncbi:response regulator [Peribacillus frigoritolerans]|uniref:ANTAR domain-containing response regulator n=1 Tax=Peribacillus TaxID=2675229 RepID=UPI0006AC6EE4|nr:MULTISPECIES: response regulator [Peribacillus]KOR81870.1 Fis family transcriptional regulator [Bacillus sp. FJAT-21352]KRF48011.1 Fis family transcriptional regulator [Bacillus sp. Soil745]MBT2604196.1 response regulator [Bacillus sp. ISL-53]MDP9738823.1 AmiR/NasT family two-component response regulator [Bacillus sp. B2I3]MEC0297665.1 response regulator [Peribacillus castrilensis]PHD73174.1 response regulator [Bacillus sp. AFS043905]